MTDGGGWTIFQRRVFGAVDFYRNWAEYKNMFGDLSSGNLYLGNENIHLFTSQRPHELRFDLKCNGSSYFAKYSNFIIFNETDGYRLQASGYNGTAGDWSDYHNDVPFSTYDNDNCTGNCATYHHAAWWHDCCYFANLNGHWNDTSSNIEWGGLEYCQKNILALK